MWCSWGVKGGGIEGRLLRVLAAPRGNPGVGQEAEGEDFSGEALQGADLRARTHPTHTPISQSVVPYLGTFLGHLLMLHLLMGDNLEVGAPEDQAGRTRILSLGMGSPRTEL